MADATPDAEHPEGEPAETTQAHGAQGTLLELGPAAAALTDVLVAIALADGHAHAPDSHADVLGSQDVEPFT